MGSMKLTQGGWNKSLTQFRCRHLHPSSVVFLHWTLPSICHRTYFHTSKGHVTWIIKKVNIIPMHCGVACESVCSLARGHVIRVCRHLVKNISAVDMYFYCHSALKLIWYTRHSVICHHPNEYLKNNDDFIIFKDQHMNLTFDVLPLSHANHILGWCHV